MYLNVSAFHPLADRLIAVARADLLVLFWLAATIGNVARLRFFSASDIAGNASTTGSADVRSANAVLQNTSEQVALAIPIHVALAVLVASSIPLIIALSCSSLSGVSCSGLAMRTARGPGHSDSLTFYPSVAGLIIAVAAAVRLSL